MSRESELTIGFALVIAMGCGVSNAAAQTDKYPRMAAIGQYLMEKNAEIQLARSAAPDSISRDATILVLGAAYTLWLVKRVIFGEVANEKVAALKDLNSREFLVLGALTVAVLLVGLWPAPLLDVMRASTQHLAQQLLVSKIAP